MQIITRQETEDKIKRLRALGLKPVRIVLNHRDGMNIQCFTAPGAEPEPVTVEGVPMLSEFGSRRPSVIEVEFHT